MTSPSIDPRLVHALSTEFVGLQQNLHDVGRTLAHLQAQLTPAPMPPPMMPAPVMPTVMVSAPVKHLPVQPAPPRQQWRPPTPTPPAIPWWQRDGVISRLLAFAGAAVTLVGVVMLLVLAASAGWFGPVARVGVGAVLSAGLIVVGSRLEGRAGGRVGALALVATGVAGLYLDVAAVTVIYGWLAPALGLIAALGVAAIGVAIATSWNEQRLAAAVVVGVAVLAPVVTSGPTTALLALFLVMQLAAAPIDISRDWPILRAVRTVPIVIGALAAITGAAFDSVSFAVAVQILVAASVAFGITIGTSLIVLKRNPRDMVSVTSTGSTILPVLLCANLFDARGALIIDLVIVSVVAALVLTVRWLPAAMRAVLLIGAAVAILQAIEHIDSLTIRIMTLLAISLSTFIAAHRGSAAAWWTGTGFGALASLGIVTVTPLDAIVYSDLTGALGWQSALTAVTLIGAAVAAALSARKVESLSSAMSFVIAAVAVVGLFAATLAAVSVGVQIGGTTAGFIAGHCAATIVWMAVAVALLQRGLGNAEHAHALLLSGLLLAGSAIAKLFLFDLVALDGVARAAAFVVVGVMLLGIGSRYARAFAEKSTVTSDAGER